MKQDLHVDVEKPIERRVIHLLNAATAKRSGIVDHNVEPPVGLCCVIDHGTCGFMVDNIDLPEGRLPTDRLD